MSKILLWIKSLFIKTTKTVVSDIASIEPDVEIIEEQLTKEDYSNELDDDWTLKDLLNQIDKTYEWLEASIWKNSWVHPSIIKAAHTIAPYIIRSSYMFDVEGYTEKFNYSKYNFPSIGCVAFNANDSQPDDNKIIGIKSVMYSKQEGLPWNYEKINGVIYLMGYCYKYKKELLYTSLHIVIDCNGFIHIPRLFRTIEHTIKKKKRESVSWFQNVFTRQQFVTEFKHENNHKDYNSAEKQLTKWICWVLNMSIERDFNYSVIVEKDNRRVSFSLQGQNIVKFFRNRFKVETTKTGRRKTIFHSVKSFIRNNGSVVKMHIRGATNFFWKDYSVSIFVPGYHGSGITSLGMGATTDAQNTISMDKASAAIIKTLKNKGNSKESAQLTGRNNGH